MSEQRIAERVARVFIAGEDWVITDDIKKLIPQVIREIGRRGGHALLSGMKIKVSKFVLDPLHSVPLDIELYEGDYEPGKVLVWANFGPARHPVPVQDRQPFDAKAIVSAIADALISLVNYREVESMDKGVNAMDNRKIASRLLFMAKEVLGMDFPTQDAMDKYMKDHPDADRSNHKVVKDPKDETSDEVEERLKKKMGPSYKTQEQRLEDAKPKHGPAQSPSDDMENHPYNQMRKRQNEKAMREIGEHYKKDPKDLTVDEIVQFNQRGRK